jgi:hypothetical protein
MSNTRKAKGTIEDILAATKLPEHTVRLCLRGDLAAEHERLEAELAALRDWEPSSLADEDPRRAAAEAIQAVEASMAESETVFVFRALGRRKYRALMDAHPDPKGEGMFSADTFPQALIAASCVEPEMDVVDAERLFDVLNAGQVETLFMGAYIVNEGPTQVPFSKAASDALRSSAQK